jgi:hypothetical protein
LGRGKVFFFSACGGEKEKKSFVGTPHTPAKDFVLCTPLRFLRTPEQKEYPCTPKLWLFF